MTHDEQVLAAVARVSETGKALLDGADTRPFDEKTNEVCRALEALTRLLGAEQLSVVKLRRELRKRGYLR